MIVLFVAGCVCFCVGYKRDQQGERSWAWVSLAALCFVLSLIINN